MIVHVRHGALKCVVDIKYFSALGRLKELLVNSFPSSPDAVNVNRTRWRVRIRSESKSVNGTGEPVDRPPNRFGQWSNRPEATCKNVIEPTKRMNPMFCFRDCGRPEFIDPTNAALAVIFPAFDCVDMR